MGVEFFPCSNCGETFPDCGVYGRCEKEHLLCEGCMPAQEPENMDEDQSCFTAKSCPCCIKGGTDGERLIAAQSKITLLCGAVGFFSSVIKSGEPWTERCQQVYDGAIK